MEMLFVRGDGVILVREFSVLGSYPHFLNYILPGLSSITNVGIWLLRATQISPARPSLDTLSTPLLLPILSGS